MRPPCSLKRWILTRTDRDLAVFAFAHQDDEYAAIPWIEAEIAAGRDVRCVYFTDGASRCPARVRDEESLAVLGAIGIGRDAVTFLGDGRRIGDGELVQNLGTAIETFARWMAQAGDCARIYVPDWEGGHPDHDAAHIAVLTYAVEHPGTDVWSFSIYHAYRCPRPWFKSLSALPWRRQRSVKHAFGKGIRLAMLCWKYPSQRRTWVGLFPGAFCARALRREEYLGLCQPERVAERPHAGELLYERMFGITYERFAALARPYVSRVANQADQTIGSAE